MSNNREYEKLLKVVGNMIPGLELTELQKDFFRYSLDKINSAAGNTITVIPGRCGLAKTTMLKALIQIMLENPYEGAIIVTNSIDRLSEMRHTDAENRADDFEEIYSRNMDKIALMTANNKDSEGIIQKYKPILLITSQRYANLEKGQIKDYLTYDYKGKKCKRTKILFDEDPTFYSFDYVGDSDLNDIDTALRNGITDLCDKVEKDWMLDQWGNFRSYIQKQFHDFEYIRNKNTYIYWKDLKRSNITDDDDRFFSIIEEYKSTMKKSVWYCMDCLEKCKALMLDGGFLSVTKAANKDQYSKTFLVIRNKLDNYLLGEDVKVIIFDATATISEKYNALASGLNGNLFVCEDCDRFNVSLDYMNIKIVDINTSRNALVAQDDAARKREIIINYLKNENLAADDTLFATYKSLHDRGDFTSLGFVNCGYLGNLRGFNWYNTLHNYVQVGVNRQRDINYLAMLFHNQPEYIDYAVNNMVGDIEKNIQYFDSLLESETIADIRNAEIAADIIQNMFRICARNLRNTDPVQVYIFMDCKQYQSVISELKYHLGRFGAYIETGQLEALAIDKIKNRKTANGKKSNAQIILEWLENLPNGQTFRTKDLLNGTNLSNKQFNKCRENNKNIKDILERMCLSKGKYRK